MHNSKTLLVYFSVFSILETQAYINPSAGSYFLQIIAAFLLMTFFQLSVFLKGRNRKKQNNSKSGYLKILKEYFPNLNIPSFLIITFKDFKNDQESSIKRINQFIKNEDLIIRSSFCDEDILGKSNAGKYLSQVITKPYSNEGIIEAIKNVQNSNKNILKHDHFIVQKYIKNFKYKGVFFSRIPEAPSQARLTFHNKLDKKECWILSRCHNFIPNESWHYEILKLSKEIERKLKLTSLDIEFLIDHDNLIHILQVRPLYLSSEAESLIPKLNDLKIEARIDSKHLYSKMTDWNPVEILGENAKLLDRSIYNYLFASGNWTKEREQIGYNKLTNTDLFKVINQSSYVDIRKSLLSFLPEKLPAELKSKICEKQIEYLIDNPSLHDRIEFDLAFTYQPIDKKIFSRWSEMFSLSENEKENYFLAIQEIDKNLWKKINLLLDKKVDIFNKLISLNLNDTDKVLDYLNKLANIYVIASRSGFAARSLLNDYSKKNPQIASKIIKEATKTALFDLTNEINKVEIFKKNQFSRSKAFSIEATKYPFIEHKESFKNIYQKDYPHCYEGIYSREFFKRLLYLTLNFWFISIEDKINAEDFQYLSYLSLDELIDFLNTSSLPHITELEKRKRDYLLSCYIQTPDIITSQNSFTYFDVFKKNGYYIGDENIDAELIHLEQNSEIKEIKNKVVLIERAEPGLDWIFDLKPKAIISRFGGPNSHVAIRCIENKIIAVLGISEDQFIRLKSSKSVQINCSLEKII